MPLKHIYHILCLLALLLAAYSAAFLLLMNPREPARDYDLKMIYHSSFRWGLVGYHRNPDGGKTSFIWPSKVNFIFAPIDYVLDIVAPHNKKDTRRGQKGSPVRAVFPLVAFARWPENSERRGVRT